MHHFFPNIKVLSCVLAFCVSDLSADSFRCGRKLVSTGDSTGDLIRVCGEPRHKSRGQGKIKVNGISKTVSVERWYYKKSARGLEHIIEIYKGQVSAVEVGER